MVQRTDLVETPDYFGEDDLHKDRMPLIYFLQIQLFCDLNVCKNPFVPENFILCGICHIYVLYVAILILPLQFLFHPGIAWTQNQKNEVNTLLWTILYNRNAILCPDYVQITPDCWSSYISDIVHHRIMYFHELMLWNHQQNL